MLKNVFFFAAVWLAAAALALLTSWPHIPRDIVGWLLLLIFGPPLYIAGEALFEWLLGPKRKYSRAQHDAVFCLIVIAYVIGLAAWVVWQSNK